VVHRTGLSGLYDIQLHWMRVDSCQASAQPLFIPIRLAPEVAAYGSPSPCVRDHGPPTDVALVMLAVDRRPSAMANTFIKI
jgi:hypothetical protein